MSTRIPASAVRVGDEIEIRTADGKLHRFVVGRLPRTEVHVLPAGVEPKAANLFTLSPEDAVTLHTMRGAR